jgi:hypothetical protein
LRRHWYLPHLSLGETIYFYCNMTSRLDTVVQVDARDFLAQTTLQGFGAASIGANLASMPPPPVPTADHFDAILVGAEPMS